MLFKVDFSLVGIYKTSRVEVSQESTDLEIVTENDTGGFGGGVKF